MTTTNTESILNEKAIAEAIIDISEFASFTKGEWYEILSSAVTYFKECDAAEALVYSVALNGSEAVAVVNRSGGWRIFPNMTAYQLSLYA